MSDQADLSVQVVDDNQLVVTKQETGDRVTYRKDGRAPVLVMMDNLRFDPDAARVKFLVAAWKVAHAKALQLGWLKA